MAYPILYKANETNFEHLGVSVLSDASKCYVSRERNGIYILEFDYPANGKDVDKIKEGMYIKSDAGYRTKNQRFVISKITKTQNEFKIYCQHISQVKTTMNAIRPDITVTSVSAMGALRTWRDNLLDSRDEFFVNSDITTVNSTTWKVENIENARDALGGKAGSILDVWGGEYEFDNLNITLHKSMGIDNPTIIAYGKNLLDLEQEQSILETYTSVFPFKKYTDDNNREQLITLPEILLDSTHLNKFTHRRILKVDFSSDENLKTVEQLRSKAKSYIKSNNVGVPKTNLKINYQDLSKVEGVFDNPALEQIDLCDRLKVYYNELGIMNENAKVVKVVWDVILEENHEIEVGDGRSSFTDSTSAKLETLQAQNDSVVARINALISEQEEAFDRYFNEKSKVIDDKVKDGYEKSLLSSEEKLRKMGEAFDEKLVPIRNQVSTTVENYNRQFQATNLEISKNRVEATKQIQALTDRVNNIQDISNNETVRELRGLVNGATSKVTELETSITREFTAVKKKNEDSLNTVKAEFTKGVNGLTSKISSLEEYKNQDGTRTESLKQWVQRDTASQLNRERTEIIRNVRDSIPTSIGGRNYITDSDKLNTKPHWGSNKWDKTVDGDTIILTKKGGSDNTGFWFTLTDLVKTQFQNETLTWSIGVKASRDVTLKYVGFETNGLKQVNITTEWQRINHTFINKFTKYFAFLFQEPTTNFNNGDKIYIRLPKLEKGNVATDWTPAPEDNNDFVKNTEFSNKFNENAQGINRQLTALEQYKNQDGVRVANMQIWAQNNTANQLTAARRSIESWVNEKGYATTSVVENKVQETANSFSREISNVRNSIPTSVGGRNYITDSDKLTNINSGGTNWEKTVENGTLVFTKVRATENTGIWTQIMPILKDNFQNEVLTWSVDVKASKNISFNNVGQETNGFKGKVDITTQWQRISHTFTNRYTQHYAFVFYEMIGTCSPGDKIYIRLPKLETGNIATDWTPAPEDTQQSINELNIWKQTATGTLNTVSSTLNDTVRHSQLRVGADKIDFGSNQVFDGRNLASMLSVSPESIQAISDRVIITPSNENLVKNEFRGDVTFNKRDLYLNKISDSNKAGDEYYFSVEARQVSGSNGYKDLNAMVHVKYKDGTDDWLSNVLYPASGYGVRNCTATIKIPDRNKEIDFIEPMLQQNTWSNYTTYSINKLTVVKKKSAELIVDGSIEGRQIKTETLETGHHKAGSITSEIIAANAVRAKHILIDDGLINNLVTHNAFISKLWAQDAFIRSLKTVKITSTQIDTESLRGKTIIGGTIDGGVIKGNVQIKLGEHGFLQPIEQGLQINAPASYNANNGVGFQIHGYKKTLSNGDYIPKGVFIYKDDDFSTGETVSTSNETLLTVEGMVYCRSMSDGNGKYHKGYAVPTITTFNENHSGLYPIFNIYHQDDYRGQYFNYSVPGKYFSVATKSISDVRFKKNIKQSKENALRKIDMIDFKAFDWKEKGKGHEKLGMIAQELEKIESKFVDLIKFGDGTERYTLNTDNLNIYSLKAIQELSTENKELKQRIIKLEEIING